MQRDFKGVWITKEIWLDDTLTWMEKLFLAEIDSLARNGECFASNDYFAKFFKLSKDRTSKIISGLAKKEYIEVHLVYKPGTKQIEKRVITTVGYTMKQIETMKNNVPIVENNYTPIVENNDTPLVENNYTPIVENNEDINTSIINTNIINNNICAKSTSYDSLFEEFWKAYPKKQNKKGAFTSFKKVLKEHSIETVMGGLEKYNSELKAKKTEKQYIMHATTFLNGARFNDEYDETEIKPSNKNNSSEFNPEDFY